jgi:prepilin-type N-terminal cleavage/methylation domain-containing protein
MFMQTLHVQPLRSHRQCQQGFSLIEVSIVTAIVLLIAVIGIPAIGGYVMENKVPKVGQELARFVMHARVNAGTSGEAPYEGIATSNLAALVADSTVLTRGTDGTVLHGLGAKGAVEVESTDAGTGFLLRLTQVNHVACPSIASVLQRVAERIQVGPDMGATQVIKDVGVPYSALAAEAACAKGDVNHFVFHVR